MLKKFSQFLCLPNINDMIRKNKSIFFFIFFIFVCELGSILGLQILTIFFLSLFSNQKQNKEKNRHNPRLIEKIHVVLSQVLKYILPEPQRYQVLRLWQDIKFNTKLNFAGNGSRDSKKKVFFPNNLETIASPFIYLGE